MKNKKMSKVELKVTDCDAILVTELEFIELCFQASEIVGISCDPKASFQKLRKLFVESAQKYGTTL